jgi:hypothetical protein
MRNAILSRLRRRATPQTSLEVHFHQGPQGQATPCFDGHCVNPRLSV